MVIATHFFSLLGGPNRPLQLNIATPYPLSLPILIIGGLGILFQIPSRAVVINILMESRYDPLRSNYLLFPIHLPSYENKNIKY